MIIIPLDIILHYCLTKTSELTFIIYHNIRFEYFWMVVKTSMRALSYNDDVRACALTLFVPYPLCKFMLTSLFSYLWVWRISILTPYHFLSSDYVCVQLLYFFFLCLHAVETFFPFFFFIHAVPFPVSFCLQAGFVSYSSCVFVGIYFFYV